MAMVIILPDKSVLPKFGSRTVDELSKIMVFYLRHEASFGLLRVPNVTVKMDFDLKNVTNNSTNVIVETKTGKKNAVVMAGAHLDSSRNSPGINNNGSTIALLLEIALKAAEKGMFKKNKNKVRFGFWGLHHYGLIGSKYYLDV